MVMGVGYIFKTKEVIFTVNGSVVKGVELPDKLANRYLYPAISLGSREIHKVEINLGMNKFMFNADDFVQNRYYKSIYDEIKGYKSFEQKSMSARS
jgi:hypothetical protein